MSSKDRMPRRVGVKRLRKGLRYILCHVRNYEADFFCHYRHEGPADMAYQAFGNIAGYIKCLLEPGRNGGFEESFWSNLDYVLEHEKEWLAKSEQRIKDEDSKGRKPWER